MTTVVDFADSLEEFRYGQSFIEAVSEVSACLGKPYNTLDTNMHDDIETFEKGSRTEASWNLRDSNPIVSLVTVCCIPDWEYGNKKGANPIMVELDPRCLEHLSADGIARILEIGWLDVRVIATPARRMSIAELWEELQNANRDN